MPKVRKRPTPRKTGPAPTAKRRVAAPDPSLFVPLTMGERADALRMLLEDERLRAMAKVGRYRVISAEPLATKPGGGRAGRRLARIVIYDYAGDRCVDGGVDLEDGSVFHLAQTTAQPMLSRDEEEVAAAIASRDERVTRALALGEGPITTLHYWSKRATDLAHRRRSAAVLFGAPGARPRLVAVVDLMDNAVAEIVPAAQW